MMAESPGLNGQRSFPLDQLSTSDKEKDDERASILLEMARLFHPE
jgi:hypothetical protein